PTHRLHTQCEGGLGVGPAQSDDIFGAVLDFHVTEEGLDGGGKAFGGLTRGVRGGVGATAAACGEQSEGQGAGGDRGEPEGWAGVHQTSQENMSLALPKMYGGR